MDKILINTIRFDAVNSVTEAKYKFQNSDERQKYINTQIQLQTKILGLDEPWYSPKRIANTIFKLGTLDLGKSNFFTSDSGSSSVRDIIVEKLPRTILLFTSSTVIVSLIGLYLGAFLADKSGSMWDRGNSFLAVSSSSFPVWWVGMLMIFAFAYVFHIFPARSTPLTPPSDPYYVLDLLYHMALPLITLVIVSFSAWAYIVRYFLGGILREDYISAKSAMGIPRRRIVYSHALKNAAPPILTSIALSLAASFGGAIIIEAVFGWPGMGKLYYDAISVMDIPIIIGITYVLTLIFVITIFVTDIIYAYFDPRVKVG
jgi:peptide/nickel transport system permease protein